MRVTVQTAQSRVFAVAVGLAALFAGSRAHAGPVEQMVEVASPPGKSDSMLVRYINGGGGVFLSTDMGKTWSLQCNGAFLAAGGRVQGPIAMLGDKTMLMLTSSGVFHADANGCGFTAEAPDLTKNVVDFALHPTDPMKVFAAVSNATGMSGLVQRSADGQWTDFGVKDALSPLSLRVVMREGAMRIYEVAVKATMASSMDGGASLPEYVMRVSDDEAKTWQEYPLPADGNGRPRLRGVDPTNPERLLIVIDRSSATDTLLLSKDGGKTTTKYQELEEFGGLTFAPDGRVWIGDLGLTSGTPMTRGLYAAANLDAVPARLPMAMYPVQCLGWAPDTNTLYACQRFWFGNVNLMTGEFSTMLRFTTAPKFVSCPGEDPAMECKAQLCLDYCGPAHFAAAPVCSAYDEPSCGKPVAAMEAEDTDPSTSVGGSSGAGTAGTAAAGSGAAGAAAGAGAISGGGAAGSVGVAGAATAGSAATPPKSSSGCSCTVPSGSAPSEQLPWFAWSALAAVWVWRRSRRSAI